MDNRIKLIAIGVRDAIEQEEVRKCYIGFEWFPYGSCMDASILLGIILEENGVGRYEYVSAVNDLATHSWLEFEGQLIDITADQFDKDNPKVVINESVNFHLGFKVASRHSIKDESKVPDIGFYYALSMVKEILRTNGVIN